MPAAAPSPGRRAWRLWTTPLSGPAQVVGAIVGVFALVGVVVTPSVVARTAGLPDRLQLVLALPAGVEASPTLVAAVQHEATLATDWLERQTGRTFRGSLEVAHVTSIRLPDAPITGGTEDAAEQVASAVGLDAVNADLLPVIVTTLGLAGAPDTCGLGGPQGVVVFLGNCRAAASRSTTTFGAGVNRTIAHELVHAMQGVAECAPNHEEGHVDDDPADLMVAVSVPGSGPPVLDAAGDDYFGRGAEVCVDIRDSVLWE